MERVLIGVCVTIISLCAISGLMSWGSSTGTGTERALFFTLPATVAAAFIVWRVARSRRVEAALPPRLRRLAHKATTTYVAFAWQWRGAAGTVRVLRSEERGAGDVEAFLHDRSQVRIYEGGGEGCVDSSVHEGTTYRYALFVAEGDGAWCPPVRLTIVPRSPTDQAYFEATDSGPGFAEKGSPSPAARERLGARHLQRTMVLSDPSGDRQSMSVQRARDYDDIAPQAVATDAALSGVVADAIFATADLLRGTPEDDGWREVR